MSNVSSREAVRERLLSGCRRPEPERSGWSACELEVGNPGDTTHACVAGVPTPQAAGALRPAKLTFGRWSSLVAVAAAVVFLAHLSSAVSAAARRHPVPRCCCCWAAFGATVPYRLGELLLLVVALLVVQLGGAAVGGAV